MTNMYVLCGTPQKNDVVVLHVLTNAKNSCNLLVKCMACLCGSLNACLVGEKI